MIWTSIVSGAFTALSLPSSHTWIYLHIHALTPQITWHPRCRSHFEWD